MFEIQYVWSFIKVKYDYFKKFKLDTNYNLKNENPLTPIPQRKSL